MKFLSLGAGVQSSVMLMLAIRGEIERPDHVIFADTGAESNPVMRHVEWCKKQCEKADIPFHIVQAKWTMLQEFDAWQAGHKKHWNTRPPLWLKHSGQFGRQCTRELKVRPVKRKMRELSSGNVELMIGISTDESKRATPSRDKWVDRLYPLIDPLKMSRADCQAWWEKYYPGVPLHPSSCIICPYLPLHRFEENHEDYGLAVELDRDIRAAYERKTEQTVYVAKDRQPLDADRGCQSTLDLDDDLYCSGGCGL